MGEHHQVDRRSFLRSGALAVAALALAQAGLAEPASGEIAPRGAGPDDELTDEVKRVFKDHFGDRQIQYGHVKLDVPADAPDGRAVPVFIESDLPFTPSSYVKALHLIVDHNPDIYLAGYELSPGMGAASIDTRIKMRRTSYVRAIAETNSGELWAAATKVFVGLNGCG